MSTFELSEKAKARIPLASQWAQLLSLLYDSRALSWVIQKSMSLE
jgi:hypothetical protein